MGATGTPWQEGGWRGRVSLGWFSWVLPAGTGSGGHVLWLKLHQGNLLAAEALVADPLGIDLLCQEVEGSFYQSRANSMEPEVATRLTQDCLNGQLIRFDFF